MIMVEGTIYSDLGQMDPTVEQKIVDVKSVYQSIGNILSTPKGTRIFLPKFGSELELLLFEPMDDITEAKIYDAVVGAIQEWEPRVEVDYALTVVEADYENHKYLITINFIIAGLSDQQFEYVGELVKEGQI